VDYIKKFIYEHIKRNRNSNMDINIWFRGLILSLLFSVTSIGQDIDQLPNASSLNLADRTVVRQGSGGSARTRNATLTQLQTLFGGVTSIYGRMGVVVAQSGDYNTSQVAENTNLYFTNARARAALSPTYPILYNSSTGVIDIKTASATESGIITQGTQDINGRKNFLSGIQTSIIYDINTNYVAYFGGTASPVNYLSFNNSSTGNSPNISASGTDANIGIDLVPKGTGKINVNSGIKVSALAGTGIRIVAANASGDLMATTRVNRTLSVTTYNPPQQHTASTAADYGSYTIPAGLLSTDGDAVKLEVTGQILGAVGVNSLSGWFGGAFVFSKTFSGGSTARSASLSFTVIRTSNTTAVIHVAEPGGQTAINTTDGDMIVRTGLNFSTNNYTINASMSGNGSSSGALLGAVRVTFEPAP
jgi:hypothetical protein